MKFFVDPDWRRQAAEFGLFQKQYGSILRSNVYPQKGARGKALIFCSGTLELTKFELVLIKAVEMAGFIPVVILERNYWFAKYYQLAGAKETYFWDDYFSEGHGERAATAIEGIESLDDLITLEKDDVRVGRFVASTALRHLRVGSLDLRSSGVREKLIKFLENSFMYADAAQGIVKQIKPTIALFVDRGYTPQGEMFDACLSAGTQAITWNAAHKSNALVLKRYSYDNRDDHPSSLSSKSWRELQALKWSDGKRDELYRELYRTYASGDWYSEVGTQFGAALMEPEEIKARLGLDPEKKTAFIFPHIFWDGTFFFGRDLFKSYEDWFVETIRAAQKNKDVNWVIKIHPANIVKNVRDNVENEPMEQIVLRREISTLPEHFFVIPAETEISTFSLFSVMDYCLTVRGTVGIEAAAFGIPVFTAGTGRYDRQGFTYDFSSHQEYLEALADIQDISRLSAHQRELAERFAYGVFVMRPFILETASLGFRKDAKASLSTKINAQDRDDLLTAADLRAFSAWVGQSDDEDFLMSSSVQSESLVSNK